MKYTTSIQKNRNKRPSTVFQLVFLWEYVRARTGKKTRKKTYRILVGNADVFCRANLVKIMTSLFLQRWNEFDANDFQILPKSIFL